jgi:hypothetical protein
MVGGIALVVAWRLIGCVLPATSENYQTVMIDLLTGNRSAYDYYFIAEITRCDGV